MSAVDTRVHQSILAPARARVIDVRVLASPIPSSAASAAVPVEVMWSSRPVGPFPDGGEVVRVSTTDWVFALGRDDAVDCVTANALQRHI